MGLEWTPFEPYRVECASCRYRSDHGTSKPLAVQAAGRHLRKHSVHVVHLVLGTRTIAVYAPARRQGQLDLDPPPY